MKILVTGAAGFIGYHTCLALVANGHVVVGLDNINNYYDPKLKFDRLNDLGFNEDNTKVFHNQTISSKFRSLSFVRIDLNDSEAIENLFQKERFNIVCHLAAQAGVRYSIDNPKAYIDSNISGFLNVLEGCRNWKVKHLVYASSSSVYGENTKVPFETSDNVDHPISLYAATKKSNELMAHTYGHLFGIKTTGLRFFTVYGPWGRPDMAYYLFAEAIYNNNPIKLFNNGLMERDFTYIDDIVKGILNIIIKPVDSRAHYKIYNVGNNRSEKLLDFIAHIEKNMGKEAIKELYPMQQGDVTRTYADIKALINDYNFVPKTNIEQGIKEFVSWYIIYKNKLL